MFTPLRATRFHMQWYTLEPAGLLVWDVVYSSHVIWLTFMHWLTHLQHPGHASLMGGTILHWPWGRGAEPVSHSSQFPSSRHMHVIPDLTTDLCSCYFFFSLGVFFSLKSPLQPCLPQPCCILWLMSDILSFRKLVCVIFYKTSPSSLLPFNFIANSWKEAAREITPSQALNTCLWNEYY